MSTRYAVRGIRYACYTASSSVAAAHTHVYETACLLSGGFWGTLVGLLFLNPLVGAAVGAGVGAASGAMTDLGINDGFLKEVGEALKPGKAALCLLVKEATTDRVIEKLRRHAGHTQLLQTNLSHTDEDHLKELLDQAKQQAEALRLS